MEPQPTYPYVHDADLLIDSVRDLLTSSNARDRVRAIRVLAAGIKTVERRVALDANEAGMSWAEIGRVYGVTRQAAHQRLSNETFVPQELFQALLVDEDEGGDPGLAEAARRARTLVKTPPGVQD